MQVKVGEMLTITKKQAARFIFRKQGLIGSYRFVGKDGAYIRENGPVCSDTLPVEGEIYWHSSMHWSGRFGYLRSLMIVTR